MYGPNPGNSGGAGGGGAGGNQSTPGATAGTNNTGGGGGGGIYEVNSANGGPGVVVIRFPGSTSASVTPGGSISACVGPANDKVARFTANGTLTIS